MENSLLIRSIDDSDALFFGALTSLSTDQAFPLLFRFRQKAGRVRQLSARA